MHREAINKIKKHRAIQNLQQGVMYKKQYRNRLYNFLFWWGMGSGIGILFAVAVDADMKQKLATHLQDGVAFLLQDMTPDFTYFLKRCLCYLQLFFFIWCLEYFVFGYMGVRILMLSRGFLFGFSQNAWLFSYGIKGILGGFIAYLPHNILLVMTITLMEELFYRNTTAKIYIARRVGVLIGGMTPIIAWVEVYIAQVLFRTYI